MLKKVVLFLSAVIFCLTFCNPAFADAQPQISAKSAILISAGNNQVLFAKDENTKRAMASTTKIMTALLTLEAAEKNNRVITITDQMVRVEGSSMGLLPGNQLTLKALAEGMLTVSGNDAANSAAIAIGGSIPGFADLMNKRAGELNLKDTHFVTPSGLDDREHYTTAHDLAILASAAMKNLDFARIVGNRLMNIQFNSPDQTRRYTNHNKLLVMYKGCEGVKTGFTDQAGRCLVSAAKRNGVSLIAVTLNASDDWNDHIKMLDYGFSSMVSYPIDDSHYAVDLPVTGGADDFVRVCGTSADSLFLRKPDTENIKRMVQMPHFIYAPVEAGQVVGKVSYELNGRVLASTELVTAQSVNRYTLPKNPFQIFAEKIKELLKI